MHRIGRIGDALLPGFLGGEHQNRRQPRGEARKHLVQHGAGGASAEIVARVAVKRVLADVEIKGRQIDRAEMVQLNEQIVEIKVVAFASNDGVQLPQAMQDPALKFRHVGGV